MTATQIQHWDEARQRSDFTNYDNQVKRPNIRASSTAPDIGYKIINENEYEGNFQKFLKSDAPQKDIKLPVAPTLFTPKHPLFI